ncbi:MAG: DUF378 domain-containing protein [Bacteroidetes bacterium]|nr:DUF378 domain-containing protein [Bacteroidota bacterium]
MKKLARILVFIGGLNWGLVGLGWLLGGRNWNVVNLILGSVPKLEAIVYVLVGVSAILACCGKYSCKNCRIMGSKQ